MSGDKMPWSWRAGLLLVGLAAGLAGAWLALLGRPGPGNTSPDISRVWEVALGAATVWVPLALGVAALWSALRGRPAARTRARLAVAWAATAALAGLSALLAAM